MITDELLDYIQKQRENGVSDADIRTPLKEEGDWTDEDIDEAFDTLDADEDGNSAGDADAENDGEADTDQTQASAQKEAASSADAEDEGQSEETEADTDNEADASEEANANTKKETVNDKELDVSQMNDAVSAGASASMDRTDSEDDAKDETSGTGKKVVLGIIIILVLLGLGGTGAFAYVKYFAGPTPDEILDQAIVYTASSSEAMKAASSEMTIAGKNSGSEVSINGAVSRKNPDPRFRAGISLNNISLPMASALKLSADGEVIYAEEALYAKLTGLPSLPMIPSGVRDAVADTWIRIDEQSVQKLATSSGMVGSIVSQNNGEDRIKQMQQAIKTQTEKIQENLKEPISVYEEHPFVDVKEELEDTTLNGTPAYHYALTIDQKKLAAWWQVYGPKVKESLPGSGAVESITPKKFLNEVLTPALNSTNGEAWIAKDAPRILRTQIEMELDLEKYLAQMKQVAPETASGIGGDTSVSDLPFGKTAVITMTLNLDDAVSITPPAQSTPVNEVVQAIQESVSEAASSPFGDFGVRFDSAATSSVGQSSGEVQGASTSRFQEIMQEFFDERDQDVTQEQ